MYINTRMLYGLCSSISGVYMCFLTFRVQSKFGKENQHGKAHEKPDYVLGVYMT
jgi:hypothetical protein